MQYSQFKWVPEQYIWIRLPSILLLRGSSLEDGVGSGVPCAVAFEQTPRLDNMTRVGIGFAMDKGTYIGM